MATVGEAAGGGSESPGSSTGSNACYEKAFNDAKAKITNQYGIPFSDNGWWWEISPLASAATEGSRVAAAGIRVCAIAPGIFETPMMAAASDEVRDSLAKSIPFPPRFGSPDEFASLVEHVISNPYLNGETIRLDGAVRMQ